MAARARHVVLIVAALCAGASLAGCANTGELRTRSGHWFPDGKKKLPGERREVFPGGVPGVTQGVPPELIRGSAQQQAEQNPACGSRHNRSRRQPPRRRAETAAEEGRATGPAAGRSGADDAPQPPAASGAAAGTAAPSGAWPAPQPQPAQQQPQPQQAPANSAWPAPPGLGHIHALAFVRADSYIGRVISARDLRSIS